LAPDHDDDALADLLLRLYAGNVTHTGVFDGHPVNTDTRPVIEYLTPRTHREARTGSASFLTGGSSSTARERCDRSPSENLPFVALAAPRAPTSARPGGAPSAWRAGAGLEVVAVLRSAGSGRDAAE
jgi:hypothetical protein